MQIKCLANCTHTAGGVERAYNSGNLYDVDDELGNMLLAFPANFQTADGSNTPVASSREAGSVAVAESKGNEPEGPKVIGPDFDGDVTAPGGDRLTVADLREIAKGFGVDVSHIERKADLIALLKTAGGGDIKFDETVEEDEENGEFDDLEGLTVSDLRNVAEDEDVDLTGLTLKADIIAAIKASRDGD